MKNASPLPNVAARVITILFFSSCWTGQTSVGLGVHAELPCADVQASRNPCSMDGTFMADQLVVLRAHPLVVDPDGKTCQQGLEEIDIDCDSDDGNNYVNFSSRLDVLRLVSRQCCDDLGPYPMCEGYSFDQPCASGQIFAKDEVLIWPTGEDLYIGPTGENLHGRTCQKLLQDIYVYAGSCGTGPNNFANEANYQRVQKIVMELNLASCCRPELQESAGVVVSHQPVYTGRSTEEEDEEEGVTTTTQQQQPTDPSSSSSSPSSSENTNNTSGATSLPISYSSFWTISAAAAAAALFLRLHL